MAVRRHPAVGPTGATGATGPQGAAPAGTPVLYGPYIVDFSAIPHDGDTLVLWTPAGGDVILGLWADSPTIVQGATAGGFWNTAGLQVGTALAPTLYSGFSNLDFTSFRPSDSRPVVPCVVTSAAPILVRYDAAGEGDMTAGHMALSLLVARAVAP